MADKQYDNTNRGVLFKAKDKQSDTHADYTGNININGEEFWLNAWVKEGKGGKFFSLSVKPKTGGSKPAAKKQDFIGDEEEGELPF